MKYIKINLLILAILITTSVSAQVGINSSGADPDPSAMLDIESTEKGLLIPRMTTAQRTAIDPVANGLMVFDTETASFWFYSGNAWQELSADNLGDHTAIQTLDMANYNIANADTVAATAAGIGNASPNEALEITGKLLVRDPGNQGAIILSPSVVGYGTHPELVLQSTEQGNGTNAGFHISRNAILDPNDNTYKFISSGPGVTAFKQEFTAGGDLSFSSASGNGTISWTDNLFIDASNGHVGVGTVTPTNKLEVNGNIQAAGFVGDGAILQALQLLDGNETDGFILTSDANGKASWQPVDASGSLGFPATPDLSCSGQVGASPTGGWPYDLATSGNYAYVVDPSSDDLKIYDTSNPTTPVLTGSMPVGNNPEEVAVAGNYAYVINFSDATLMVIDISDPTSPVLSGSVGIGTGPESLAVSGSYAYVSSSDLQVIDVSDPTNPTVTGTFALGASSKGVAVSGNYAYVVSIATEDMKVIDVSDPASPSLTGTLTIGSSPLDVEVSGNYAVVVDSGSDDLKMINVSNPAAPVLEGSVGMGLLPISLAIAGDYAFVIDPATGSLDIKVVNISDPTNPVIEASIPVGAPTGISVSGNFAYVTDDGDLELKVFKLSCGSNAQVTTNPITGEQAGTVLYDAGANMMLYFDGANWVEIEAGNDNDSSNELQTLSQAGTDVTLSNRGGTISVADNDNDASNELQSLSQTGTDVSLSNGGGTISVADNDNDASNELQSLSQTGTDVSLSNGGGTISVADNDNDASNEIQSLSQSGTEVTLSVGGGSISVADDDNDPENEIQDLNGVLNSGNDAGGQNIANLDTVLSNVIGIGTSSPGASLHVSGDFRLDDGTQADGYVLSSDANGVASWRQLDGQNLLGNSISLDLSCVLETGELGIGNFPADIALLGDTAYVIDESSDDLKIIDVSNPAAPSLIGSYGLGPLPFEIKVAGDYAYITDRTANDLKILNISNPVSVGLVSQTTLGGDLGQMVIQDDYLFIIQRVGNELISIDISNPASPVEVGSVVFDVEPFYVSISGNTVFVSGNDFELTNGFLGMVDITTPSSPSLISATSGLSSPSYITVSDGYAYVADINTVKVFDISDPLSVSQVSSWNNSYTGRMEVIGNTLYTVNTVAAAIQVVDITSPLSPIIIQTVFLDGRPDYQAIAVSDQYIFVGQWANDIFKVYSRSCSSPVLIDPWTGELVQGDNPIKVKDNLGNHIATQNIELRGNYLSGDGSNEGIFVNNVGRVGIGTNNPDKAQLQVNGSATANIGVYGYLNSTGTTGTDNIVTNYSIYANNRIAASEFHAHSDERIKHISGLSNTSEDLITLMQIQVTNYSLIDTLAKGSTQFKKVIAQQVREVYPQAVTSDLTEVIPDIYQRAKVKDGWIMLSTTLKTGEWVKIITENASEIYKVTAVDDGRFQVAQLQTSIFENHTVFVYGRQVDDFHTVDYEAIAMLNVSATQAQQRKIENQQQRIEKLEADNKKLSQQLSELHQLKELVGQLQESIATNRQKNNNFAYANASEKNKTHKYKNNE